MLSTNKLRRLCLFSPWRPIWVDKRAAIHCWISIEISTLTFIVLKKHSENFCVKKQVPV